MRTHYHLVADTHRHANTEMEIECYAMDEQEEPSDMEEGKQKKYHGDASCTSDLFLQEGQCKTQATSPLLQDGNSSRRVVLAQSSPPRQNDEVVEAEKYVYST
jgi:hypothetical protein